jgi:tRNA threonylcarbamoyladenosine biosynthesis protein TsaB
MFDILLQTVLASTEVSLYKSQKVIGSVRKSSLQKSENTFVFDLYNLMEKHQVKTKDIDYVWVVNGPGYFTGIRTGLAIAKTFVDVLKIPIRLVNTFQWLETGISDRLDYIKIFIPSSAREGYLGFMKDSILEETRLVLTKDVINQDKPGFDDVPIYTSSQELSEYKNITYIEPNFYLPCVYDEATTTQKIIPEYFRTEDQLFRKQ